MCRNFYTQKASNVTGRRRWAGSHSPGSRTNFTTFRKTQNSLKTLVNKKLDLFSSAVICVKYSFLFVWSFLYCVHELFLKSALGLQTKISIYAKSNTLKLMPLLWIVQIVDCPNQINKERRN